MFEIGKKFKFEAAHQLVHHDGKCQRPHGHSYEFEIIVEGRDLKRLGPAAGMVDDYDLLTKAGKDIEDLLDHRNLNEVLDSDTTTAEELTRVVWEMASARLPNLVEVRVRETAKTFASYRPRRAAERRIIAVGEAVVEDLRERLFKGVDTSDPSRCWEFQGAKDEAGYGYLSSAMAGTKKAHRVSAWLAGDDIDGMVVLHTCDNPMCINPAHLVTGTHEDNEADKDAKGRRPIGEQHGAAKLNEEQVRAIVTRCQAGELRRAVAADYGVSTALISAIITGRVWRNITGLARP